MIRLTIDQLKAEYNERLATRCGSNIGILEYFTEVYELTAADFDAALYSHGFNCIETIGDDVTDRHVIVFNAARVFISKTETVNRLYHFTNMHFNQFDLSLSGKSNGKLMGPGVYLTTAEKAEYGNVKLNVGFIDEYKPYKLYLNSDLLV